VWPPRREGLFFEAEAKPVHGPSHCAVADNDTAFVQFGLKLAQAHMAFRCNAIPDPALMGFQFGAAVTANLANGNIAGLAQLVGPTHRCRPANREGFSRLARTMLQAITRRRRSRQ
jgi:hypothetical protein